METISKELALKANDCKSTMDADKIREAARIVERLKTDEAFAHSFLYGSSSKPGMSIAPLRSHIISQIRKTYQVELAPYAFSTALYEHLWSEGTWRVLDSYKFHSTFFHWLGTVASHCVIAYLEENGYIHLSPKESVANTRLVMKSKSPEYCLAVITDMVKIAPLRDFLIAVYVDRLDRQTIQERFDMDDEMYKLTYRTAEKTLKTALLNTVNPYADVLVCKGVRKVLVSSELLNILGQTKSSTKDDSPLREVLGIRPDDAEFENKVIDFLYKFSDSIGWSDEDKFVWQSRFIKNMKPVKVAEQLPNRSRPWVDTRYSRLQADFRIEIRKWWARVSR